MIIYHLKSNTLIVENSKISNSDDFDGYSEASDGEYSCMLQIIKDTKDEEIKKKPKENLEQPSLSDLCDTFEESDHGFSSVCNDHGPAESPEDDVSSLLVVYTNFHSMKRQILLRVIIVKSLQSNQ